MANEQTQEMLVLNDRSGNWYAIPRDVVERHRATGKQKEQIERLFAGDDVSGYRFDTAASTAFASDAAMASSLAESAAVKAEQDAATSAASQSVYAVTAVFAMVSAPAGADQV